MTGFSSRRPSPGRTTDTKLTILADFQRDLTGNAFPVSNAILRGATVVNMLPTKLFLGDPSFNRFDHEQFRIGYQFEHRFNDALTFKQNLRYGEVALDYRYLTGVQTGISPIVSRVSRALFENTENFTVDNQLHANVATGPLLHKLLVGLDHQRFGLDSLTLGGTALTVPSLNVNNPVYFRSISMPTTRMADVVQDAKQVGVYIQDQIKWHNVVVTAGGRYDWANMNTRTNNAPVSTNDEAFTKRIGVTYLFESGFAPYVSYADSFLPTPNVDAKGQPYKPTTAQQYEAGVKYQMPSANVLLTLAFYDLTQQNALTPDPANLNFRIQTGEVRSRGVEAQATASLTEGLSLVASYTYQDLEVTKTNIPAEMGKVPILTPEQMASAFLDYTFRSGPLTGFGFGGGVRYIGSTFMDPANTVSNAAYTVYDAAVHYETRGIKMALNVSNLFDKSMASCTLAGGCQWISPRIVTGTLKYRW